MWFTDNTSIQVALWRRYATKKFDPSKKISSKDMQTLKESLRLSPSSFWLQPRKFVIVTDQDKKNALVEHSRWQKQVADCDALFVLCSLTTVDETHIQKYIDSIVATRWISEESLAGYKDMMIWSLKNRSEEEKKERMDKQLYIALWFLMETAGLLQIDTCPMEWFIPAKYDEILGLEKHWLRSVVVCPVWYRDHSDSYEDKDKVRFTQEDMFITI